MKVVNAPSALLWVLLGLLPCQFAEAAFPVPQCSLPADSALGFAATWEGTVFRGAFKSFDAIIQFDPADLENSRFDVHIDVTSGRTGSRDRDEGMAEPDWFDFSTYPGARYQASRFQSLGDGWFQADGQLELKGVTRSVPVKFNWRERPAGAAMTGGARVSRLDFGVGEGDWASDEIIGLLVEVEFSLELAPCDAR